MALILLIGFILCLFGGLLLSVVLIYQDVMPHRSNGTNDITEHDYFRERILAALFGIGQTGLSIAGMTAIVIALTANTETANTALYWLDAVILCTLQLLAGPNVRILIQVC